jgi:tetratricopeptide (TPR) repeat protein
MTKENPKVQILLDEARQLELDEKPDNAIEKYTKVLVINSNCIQALDALGLIYELREKFEQAIAYRKRVIELKPQSNLAYAKLARVMMKFKKIEKAIVLYNKAISLKSKKKLLPWVYKGLGDALCQKGNIDQAITVYKKAIKLYPEISVIYLGIGMALFKQKNWQETIEYFKKALNKNPSRKIIYKIVNKIGNLNDEDLFKLLDSAIDFSLNKVNFKSEEVHLSCATTIDTDQEDNFRLDEKIYINPETKVFSINNLDSSLTTENLFFVSQHGAPPYNNYYHWMFQIIPQIHLWRCSIVNNNSINKIVFPFRLDSSFQKETLEILGVSECQIIELADRASLQTHNSLSFASSLKGHPRKWVGELLRREFLSNNFDTSINSKRIYICRNKASYRQIVNQNECDNFLQAIGFKSVCLESLSVREQATLFSQADVVLSPHGAGLSNIVFCKPNTKVIEIFPKSVTPTMYRKISSYCNLKYYYLLCKDIDNCYSKNNPHLSHLKDIIINLNHLSKLINLANIY